MKKLIIACIFLSGCTICKEYSAMTIQYGEMIVRYNKEYISKDTTIKDDEKKLMLDACNEYLKLLKQE